MISLLLALAAAAADAPRVSDQQRYRDCIAIVREKATDGEQAANAWILANGGQRARQCLGMAYVAQARFAAAATAFQNAARAAESVRDPSVPDLWAQAGNAALLGGDNAGAETSLSSALAVTTEPAKRAALLTDRARAATALGKLPAARADLDAALKLTPADADAWLLSAALARRENHLKRAETDIAQAAKLAPKDAEILVEQGNIAGLAGRFEEAKAHWRAALAAEPQSDAAARAKKALAENGG
jgi:Tfp pilus assembly protein PilF